MGSDFNLELFERHRADRRELLNYILGCNRQNVALPPGLVTLDEVDLDSISVQYVIDRVSKGLVLEIADAFICNNSGEICSNSETVPAATTTPLELPLPDLQFSLQGEAPRDLELCLPAFETGLSEDDIRETAYEVLLASVGAAGGLMSLTKEKKEDVLRSGKWKPQSNTSGLAGLISIMRRQLQISEESDQRITEALFHASNGRLGKRIDCLLLPLELLCNTTREDFSDVTLYPLWQKRQLNILKEGILNNFHWNLDRSDHLAMELMASISNAEETAAMPASKGSRHRAHDALKRIKDVCLAISDRAGKVDEVSHWADGYFLNVRLYGKLLSGIFDLARPNRFIEEVEEVLELLKSTWRVMGINQTIHDTCYTWVLFKQFVSTDEFTLLQHAAQQMKKITSDKQRSSVERAYLKNLRCTMNGQVLSHVQSVLQPMKSWIDEQLHDYHLHFLHDRTRMEALLVIAMTSGRLLVDEETAKTSPPSTSTVAKQVEEYVTFSVRKAYARVLADFAECQRENVHHGRLISLAEAVKKLAEHDISFFNPLFSRWEPSSAAVTVSVLHTSYYKELKPFLENSSLTTEDEVVSVISAADDLEQYLLDQFASLDNGDGKINEYKKQMTPFEVETISANLIMRCITAKLDEVLKHVETAFNEESWEPCSAEHPYGGSASDIFHTIDKAVEKFFSLELPMRISQLKDFTDGLSNAMETYSKKILTQLGDKADLIPPAPALSRHKKELSIRSFSKKKVSDPRLPDEKRCSEINTLTTAKLCVRLNTLHFLLNQIDVLEGDIKKRWSTRHPQHTRKQIVKTKQSEEIFPGNFDLLRKVLGWVLEQTCEFTGLKLIFWDMREAYVDNLYKGGVTQCRVEKVVNGLDSVLGQLCEVLVDPLRDQVVYGLLEASLEGFLWVLLDGGPLRSFSQSDTDVLDQDLNVLKEFFVADGDGLPSTVVNNAASQVHQILNLYRLETHTVVENFRRATEQIAANTLTNCKATPQVPDSEILLRVLCHRKDKEAAKFLRQIKFPKR